MPGGGTEPEVTGGVPGVIGGVPGVIGGVTVHLLALNEVERVSRDAQACLPGAELAAIDHRWRGRRRMLAQASRVLTRVVLGAELSCSPSAVQIVLGAAGRPGLAGPGPVSFSCSHDRELLVLAVTGSVCGVDVEDGPESDLRAVAYRFCAPAELAALCGARTARQLWAAKESVAKATGLGLRAGLSSISFADDPGTGWSAVRWRNHSTAFRVRSVDLGDRQFALTVGTTGTPRVRIHTWRPETTGLRWELVATGSSSTALVGIADTLTERLAG